MLEIVRDDRSERVHRVDADEQSFASIEAKVAFAIVLVRTVASEASSRQDRTDLRLEIDSGRLAGVGIHCEDQSGEDGARSRHLSILSLRPGLLTRRNPSPAFLILVASTVNLPFLGGTVVPVPAPTIVVPVIVTDARGE